MARGVRIAAPASGPPIAGRATFEFWVELDGSPGPVEAVSRIEGAGLEGDVALTNEVARAISRCRWIPGTERGKPARALVSLPLRFAPSPEAAPAVATGPGAREEIRPPREMVAGCVPRALSLPAPATRGAVRRASFLVRIEPDGSQGAVAAIGLPDLDAEARRALADEVAAAAGGCRFAPGTVNGQPARTFWLVEVEFTAPASPPPAGPRPDPS